MKRLFILLGILVLTINAYPGNQWQEGTGEDSILGSISPSDIDGDSFENIVDPLDRLTSNLVNGCRLSYASAATITVGLGEVVLSNSADTIHLMQKNTSATTVDWTMIDTGAEETAKRYYLYAYQATVTDTDFDITISLSSSAPTGKTYFKRLGSFYNNSSGDIEQITNDGDEVSVDATVKGWINFNGSGTVAINDSYNVTSITDNGIGDYTITWDRDFANATYSVSGMSTLGSSKEVAISIVSQAVGSVNISMKNYDGSSVDPTTVCLMAIGDQ